MVLMSDLLDNELVSGMIKEIYSEQRTETNKKGQEQERRARDRTKNELSAPSLRPLLQSKLAHIPPIDCICMDVFH